jgi:hypothetical protein
VSEIDGLRERVETARRRYAALPVRGWGEPGPQDEQTGERWDRGNVLGHVAEMTPYWVAQLRAVLAGADAFGRDEAGTASRRAGIDTGREAGEVALLGRVDAGIGELLALLADMHDGDLERRVTQRGGQADRQVTVRQAIETVLVGHLEEHLRQLGAT